MNKVITINLGGTAYQLEEHGYEFLRAYLESAALRLGNNPDKDEIIADIERAIGDKCRALLSAHKSVVLSKEIESIVESMGPVQDDPVGEAGDTDGPRPPEGAPPPRRLFKIKEGATIAGVCNGLAAYFNIDPTLVRLGFVLIVFLGGAGILTYIVLAFVMPTAKTPEEKAAATGYAPFTAQEFIRRAKQGYYEGVRGLGDRQARREWKRRFKEDMRGWKRSATASWRQSADEWQAQWHRHWAEQPGTAAGVYAARTAFDVAALVCLLFIVFAVFGHGSWFGFFWHVPQLLLALLLVVLVWKVALLPFRGFRRFGYRSPLSLVLEFFAGVILFCLLVRVVHSHVPGLHGLLREVSDALHSFADWIGGSS
jgi:phage shock protein PspC (stress-responsive transcriptional regulator)